MGCWLSFRGSLTIDPPITEQDKEEYSFFSESSSFPANQKANYVNPWFINEENRLECHACKFFEHYRWMEYIYDKFFDPKGYDVYGSLLYSGEGEQNTWKVLRYDNGKEFHPHIDEVHLDMDFWEWGAEYARKKREELRAKCQGQFHYVEKQELDPEQYGGLFSK